jgi:hypothetical protein
VVLTPATDENVRPRIASQAVSVVSAHEPVGLSSAEQFIVSGAPVNMIFPRAAVEKVASVSTEN